MAQSDRFFKNNQKDPAPPAALLSFSFMSSIQIVPDLGKNREFSNENQLVYF